MFSFLRNRDRTFLVILIIICSIFCVSKYSWGQVWRWNLWTFTFSTTALPQSYVGWRVDLTIPLSIKKTMHQSLVSDKATSLS